jgi:hypothetical protein
MEKFLLATHAVYTASQFIRMRTSDAKFFQYQVRSASKVGGPSVRYPNEDTRAGIGPSQPLPVEWEMMLPTVRPDPRFDRPKEETHRQSPLMGRIA